MAKVQYLNPPGLGPAQGLYSMCTLVPAGTDTYHVAGQLAVGKDGAIVGVGDFAAQFHQVFSNLGDLLKALGETWDSVIVFRTYLVHSQSIRSLWSCARRCSPNCSRPRPIRRTRS